MHQMALVNNGQPTMSSREIADLVESRHDSVKRTVERLAEKGAIVQPPLVDEQWPDDLGRYRVSSV
jgi:phage regulator Rha-like protein